MKLSGGLSFFLPIEDYLKKIMGMLWVVGEDIWVGVEKKSE